MHQHGPSVLPGPRTQTRPWWLESGPEPAPELEAVALIDPADDAAADPSIRITLVRRIREEIANGTYETPEKWDIALDRLLDRLEYDRSSASD